MALRARIPRLPISTALCAASAALRAVTAPDQRDQIARSLLHGLHRASQSSGCLLHRLSRLPAAGQKQNKQA